MSRFARLPLEEIRDCLEFLGETAEIRVGPRTLLRAAQDAGARLVWLSPGTFRFGKLLVQQRAEEVES